MSYYAPAKYVHNHGDSSTSPERDIENEHKKRLPKGSLLKPVGVTK
ncbi:MAG: hypothetical protein PHN88_11990 [Ignavibacteria bacterium]|nr:hypothetical protein [Ignavibacteria bacterium]